MKDAHITPNTFLHGRVGASTFTGSARRLGIVSASGTVLLSVAYAIPLTAGLLSLPSPDAPIGDPWFPMMEILIIVTMPLMVGLMAAVHAWAAPQNKVYSLLALVFMSLLTVITCSVHFVILTVTHQAEIRRAVVAAFGPVVRVALSHLRAGHPCLGCVLRAGGVGRRASLSWKPPR